MDKHAPEITRLTSLNHNEPWYNSKLLIEKRKRRALERKWRSTRDEIDLLKYKQQKHHLNRIVLKTKQQYYSNLINNDTSKQNLFKIVNKIIKKPTNTPYPEHTNSEILAEEFSSFFKSKIENIRKNFDSYKGNPLEMDIKSGCNLSSFSTVNSDELYKIIKNSPNKTCNLDPQVL